MTDTLVSPLANTLVSKGHRIIKDVIDPAEINMAQLALISFLKENEKEISVHELWRRAKVLNSNFGQKFSDLVYSKQKEISPDCRPYHLLFPGTVWEGENRDRGIPELYWRDDIVMWWPNYHWMGFKLDERYRLVQII